MSISIRRADDGAFELVDGLARLRASLDVFGVATVTDLETHETFEVHEVNGQVVAVADKPTAVVETIAATAIERAARK